VWKWCEREPTSRQSSCTQSQILQNHEIWNTHSFHYNAAASPARVASGGCRSLSGSNGHQIFVQVQKNLLEIHPTGMWGDTLGRILEQIYCHHFLIYFFCTVFVLSTLIFILGWLNILNILKILNILNIYFVSKRSRSYRCDLMPKYWTDHKFLIYFFRCLNILKTLKNSY
jgi:hypothetical protein